MSYNAELVQRHRELNREIKILISNNNRLRAEYNIIIKAASDHKRILSKMVVTQHKLEKKMPYNAVNDAKQVVKEATQFITDFYALAEEAKEDYLDKKEDIDSLRYQSYNISHEPLDKPTLVTAADEVDELEESYKHLLAEHLDLVKELEPLKEMVKQSAAKLVSVNEAINQTGKPKQAVVSHMRPVMQEKNTSGIAAAPRSAKTRIVVIGVGSVGSATAYTLLLRERMEELVLIDSDKGKATGDALDMNHGLPFIGKARVWAGTYEDCRGADIIIITAGASQKPGENRDDLLKRNIATFESITTEILKYNKDGILLIATNPVDVLSYFTWKKSGWPAHRIIGSGTLLDSARFRYLVSEQLQVDSRSVHAHIIGEHGDTEVPVWSLANIAGTSLTLTEKQKEDIFSNTRNAANQIIAAKGSTYYAIALALDRICTAILRNEGAVLNVSTLLTEYSGVSGFFLGVPCIVDRSGVRATLPLTLNEKEKGLLKASATKVMTVIQSIKAAIAGPVK